MYQVLYRKWRPAIFANMVGQPHITKTLLRQLQSGRLAHAYLFTGSRGTGKTTCAKILARAVNCERPNDGEPCNACPSCLGILNGSIPDVAEIDAASHSGVDNIRALREETVYSPVAVRYRVYIIDEVHMLSAGAFNALLKTLEEPPAHVLFVLATTETHKIPATIASRCQRFAFRRISEADISALMGHICRQEGIDIEPAALDLLAHMADGALRDGLSLLEQCIAGGLTVSEGLVREILGISGLHDLAAWLLDLDNLSLSLNRLNLLYQSGLDFSSILGQLSSMLRDLLMGQMLGDLLMTRLPIETASALSEKWPPDRILFALSHLQESLNQLSRCADKRLEAEMCLIRLAAPEPLENKRLSNPPLHNHTPAPPPPAPAVTPAPRPLPASENDLTSRSGNVPINDKHTDIESLKLQNAPSNDRLSAVQDPRWTGFITSLNPLLHDTMTHTHATVHADKLVIHTDDPFALGLFQGADFIGSVNAHFPGGLELAGHQKQVKAPPGTALDALVHAQGDLVIEE